MDVCVCKSATSYLMNTDCSPAVMACNQHCRMLVGGAEQCSLQDTRFILRSPFTIIASYVLFLCGVVVVVYI